jgi:hypothetical protein
MLKYFKSIQQIYIPGSVNPGQELRFGPWSFGKSVWQHWCGGRYTEKVKMKT